MSWPDGERYSCPLQSLVVSLISRINSGVFSDRRRTVLSKFFDTQVPSIPTEELVLPRHARCVRSRLRCNGHSLWLSSYNSSIGRIENPFCRACGHSSQDTSHLILYCPATDFAPLTLATLSLFTTSRPGPRKLPDFWGSMVTRHAPIPRKGSGNNNNNSPQNEDLFDDSSWQELLLLLPFRFTSVTQITKFAKHAQKTL